MKKVFSIIFVLIFLTAICCTNVSSAEKITEISNMDEFVSFLENGGKGIIVEDFTIKNEINSYSDISLDLNGHVISVDDSSGFATIIFRNDTKVVLCDSQDCGGILDLTDDIKIVVEDQVDFTVESGEYDDLTVWGGKINLLGGIIRKFSFDEVWPIEIDLQNSEIMEWNFGQGVINIVPENKLPLGFKALKNKDNKFKIQYCKISKAHENITVYYDAFLTKAGKYQLTEDGTAPEKVYLKILYVNNGDAEVVPMKCIDKKGRIWRCEFDKAYVGAEVVFTNDLESTATSYITNLPDKNELTYNAEKLWHTQTVDLTWYYIAGATVLVVIAITITVLFITQKLND